MICFRETTFWAKTSLSFVFRGPNSVLSEVFRHAIHNGTSFKAVWWSVSEKPHFGLKHYFPLYLESQTQCTLKFFRCVNHNDTNFKAVWWSVSEKKHFGLKHHFPLYLEGPNSVHPEVIRCANHNGTNFTAVWWSVSEKPHFEPKHHFHLYLEGQTQYTSMFSAVPITMVQISKLYDDLFVRNHIVGQNITFLCI